MFCPDSYSAVFQFCSVASRIHYMGWRFYLSSRHELIALRKCGQRPLANGFSIMSKSHGIIETLRYDRRKTHSVCLGGWFLQSFWNPHHVCDQAKEDCILNIIKLTTKIGVISKLDQLIRTKYYVHLLNAPRHVYTSPWRRKNSLPCP